MFIQLHNQYLPLSFKCLSEIDNISKFSLRLSFAWIKMFTELCTFTLGEKSPRQSKPLFCLASAIISLGFSKIWINCKDFVLYLFCIREVSIRGSQEIFQRGWIMIVFKVCFFDSCFKKFILSGNLHSLLFIFQGILIKRSYKRSYLENKQVIVLPRTDHVTGKEKPARTYWVHTTPVEFETENSLWQSIKCFPSKLRRRRNSKTQE